ncbi:LysR substrate-binding domain-containing protein [Oceanicola sp. 502str15]|uniref:LysR substrate-binding domain-containing protein n=1 Tax=Oceanicola sp. 502str15 TaxID=2696061 RepID=UPI002094F9D2|nr:LysR substrate-binding domain-containing protein [Oceanicola sp. 502str15]MCO6384809.1 LysR family transcriptional regulator [Oceanicola sp. 502str15]
MARTENLNAILYFESVARRGTLSRAAEELSVSPSAVSQQIKLLEQQLGVKLFRRDGRQLSLTLEGEQLYQSAGTALRMLKDARQNLGRSRETRRLNLRVAPSFGVLWLGPRLSRFVEKHPEWELRVDAAPDPTDFDREIMDLDIRYGTGDWRGMHVEPVVEDHILPLATPDYLARLEGNPLEAGRFIDSARNLCQWDTWLLRNGIETPANRKTLLMDRSSMALQLALDGIGMVLESLVVAGREVAEGRLVPVTPQVPVLRFPAHWAICPSRYLGRRAVQIFLGWIAEEAELHDAEVAGIVARHGLVVESFESVTELTG